MLVTHQLAFRLLKNICCSLREKCKVWSTLLNTIFIYPNVVDFKWQELRFTWPGSVIRFSAQSAELSSRSAFHFVLADERHSLLSFSEQTSDVESGPWLYYTDNYLVQFDECHFLMASLEEKSCNDVVQLTSERIQCVIGVTQVRWAPLGVSLQTDRVRDPGTWRRLGAAETGRIHTRGWGGDRSWDSSKDLCSSLCLWMCSRPTKPLRIQVRSC